MEWQPGILAGDKGGRAIGAAVAALRSGPEDRDRVLHGEALAVRAVWEAMGGADMGVERHEVVCQLCERWSMAETQGVFTRSDGFLRVPRAATRGERELSTPCWVEGGVRGRTRTSEEREHVSDRSRHSPS